jgi:hypothetical protein
MISLFLRDRLQRLFISPRRRSMSMRILFRTCGVIVLKRLWRAQSKILSFYYTYFPLFSSFSVNFINSYLSLFRMARAPHKGFSGTDVGSGGGGARDGPVQFEKEDDDADVFGLEEFMSTAKRGREDKDEGADKRPRH